MPMIDPARWRALEPLLDRALELSDVERGAWLAALRAEAPDLAGELSTLLAHEAEADARHFLEEPPEGRAAVKFLNLALLSPEGQARFRREGTAYAAADPLLRDAIRIGARHHRPHGVRTAYLEATLGMLLARRGEHRAADSLLTRAIRTLERQLPPQHRSVRELHGWLADLRAAQGRHAEAARHRAIATAR